MGQLRLVFIPDAIGGEPLSVKLAAMPHVTNQRRLKRDYTLKFVSMGPKGGMWRAHYLKCPLCGYFVLKGAGYDECTCGNIKIDSDTLRVAVLKTPESDVETYNATKNRRRKK